MGFVESVEDAASRGEVLNLVVEEWLLNRVGILAETA